MRPFFVFLAMLVPLQILAAECPDGKPDCPTVQAGDSEQPSVSEHLQSVSVTVAADRAEGSGVAINRGGVTYILTAGHVCEYLRKTRSVIDPKTGTTRTLVEFRDANIVKVFTEDGKTVGESRFLAEVIKYSDADNGEDVGILRVRKKDFIPYSTKFYLDSKLLEIGTPLLHVGSLLGQQGSNSMTDGILSQHGRMIGNDEFVQVSTPAFPGSSGGGVYTKDGQYMAMLVRGAGETFCLATPISRIVNWTKDVGLYWILDPQETIPSAADLKKMPVEDIGVTFPGAAERQTGHDEEAVRFMIRTLGRGRLDPPSIFLPAFPPEL